VVPSSLRQTTPLIASPSKKPTAALHKESISLPVPKEALNCDISHLKDAMSALNRAKSEECKEFIHNVTCLQKVGKLYDTGIKNTCHRKHYPGRGFESIPYEFGKGPPVRVVFLMSVHGRAVRQVKRLFKAIYHTDHYYYIHVDSVCRKKGREEGRGGKEGGVEKGREGKGGRSGKGRREWKMGMEEREREGGMERGEGAGKGVRGSGEGSGREEREREEEGEDRKGGRERISH
jgi:hypothetical protein